MNNLVYHEVLPSNLKSSYDEFTVVDWRLSHPNRKLNVGSVRIEGEVRVTYNNKVLSSTDTEDGTPVNEKIIYYDHLVGANALFESITTTINAEGGRSVVETLNEYPRWCKMSMSATAGRNDMLNSNNVCEMKAPIDDMTVAILQGEIPASNPSNDLQRLDPDFSVRPLFVLNSGAGQLGYDKTGDIDVSTTLARVFAVLFGNDVNSKVKYSVTNLRLRYTTSPMDDNSDPVVLKTKLMIKNSIQSSFANIQTNVPALVSAVTVSFQTSANENTAVNNNLELNKVPSLTQTQFLFNDSSNTLVSYILRNNSEVIDRAIGSMMDTGRNALNTQNLANNNGFLCGLDFDQVISLQKSKFALQLTSGISSSVPMVAYMYFHSFVEL